jgi:hypothetical protein
MAGLPVPVKGSSEEMILSIRDLQAAGSAKLSESARGMYAEEPFFMILP